jgi:hypothetical protein
VIHIPSAAAGGFRQILPLEEAFYQNHALHLHKAFIIYSHQLLAINQYDSSSFAKKKSQLNFETFRLIALHGMSDNEC